MVELESKIEKFYIHFDQQEHYLSVDEYKQVLKSTEDIFENLTKDIIEINDDIELTVYAPEKGCIIAILGLMFSAGAFTVGTASFLLQFIGSEEGKHIIKRFTGNEPIYYIDKGIDLIKDLMHAIFIMPQEELKKIIEELKKNNEKIIKLDKSLKAKNDFYRICDSNKGIKAIGFSKDNVFPITRQDFIYHLTDDIIRDLGIINEYKKLTIVRPVAADNKKDKWTLENTETKESLGYEMKDDDFQKKTLKGNFLKQSPKDDEIIAEVEYTKELKNGYECIKNRKISKVYKLNETQLEEFPKNFKLNEPKKKGKTNESPGQTSFLKELNLGDLDSISEENKQ